MRTRTSDTLFPGRRGRSRTAARLGTGRKSRVRWIDLEALEIAADCCPQYRRPRPRLRRSIFPVFRVWRRNGNANSPAVVIDPYNSQKLFAVWGVDESQVVPAHLRRIDDGHRRGGLLQQWRDDLAQSRHVSPSGRLDPATIDATTGETAYTQVTDPSVAFDGRAMFTY